VGCFFIGLENGLNKAARLSFDDRARHQFTSGELVGEVALGARSAESDPSCGANKKTTHLGGFFIGPGGLVWPK